MIDIRHAAQRLGGEVRGRNQIVCPGPGHSPNDRSLSVKLYYGVPDGFVVHSFAGDDPIVCRDHVRERLGLSAWQPSRRERSYTIRSDNQQTDGELQPMTVEELERIERAVALWNDAADPCGTAVEGYLHSR